MPNKTLTVLFSCALVASCGIACAQEVPSKNCVYGSDRLLALDENEFDQDMSGGWRALAFEPGCALIAADLLHDYREAHHKDSWLLFWHEAQVRTDAGQYSQAFAGESTLTLSKG
jgi:hypothetical protein